MQQHDTTKPRVPCIIRITRKSGGAVPNKQCWALQGKQHTIVSMSQVTCIAWNFAPTNPHRHIYSRSCQTCVHAQAPPPPTCFGVACSKCGMPNKSPHSTTRDQCGRFVTCFHASRGLACALLGWHTDYAHKLCSLPRSQPAVQGVTSWHGVSIGTESNLLRPQKPQQWHACNKEPYTRQAHVHQDAHSTLCDDGHGGHESMSPAHLKAICGMIHTCASCYGW